jgi:hypothetical protein
MIKNLPKICLLLPALVFAASPLLGQEKPRVSPHETVTANIDGNDITVVYGRPYTKDPKTGEARKVWGTLVPYGKPWRMGADEATLLTTKQPIDLGGKTLPAGTYSLFMLPQESGVSKLILNKQTGQWGTKYDEAQDFARVDLKREAADKPADQFTIAIEKTEGGGGVLKMTWADSEYWIPFTNKK